MTDLAAAGGNDQGGAGTLTEWAVGNLAGQTDQGGSALITMVPAAPVVPPGLTRIAYRRRSRTWTAPDVDPATGDMVKQQPATVLADTFVGYRQIVINARDRTFYRGKRVRIVGAMTWSVPFGPEVLSVRFPMVRPFEDLSAALALGRDIDGAPVAVYLRDAGTGDLVPGWAWEGYFHKPRLVASGDNWYWEADAKGFLHEPEDDVHQPLFDIYSASEVDIGRRIAQVINMPSRHFHFIQPVDIGIGTLQRGSLSMTRGAMIQQLLGLAWTGDGRQWRVMNVPGHGRRGRIELPHTSVDYHVTLGQWGLDISGLESEGDEVPNVIYGEYVDKDGNRSQNIKYPHEHEDAAPAFPLAVGHVFNPGSGTTGFAPFAEWLREHGYHIYSQDTYDARDVDDVEQAQRWLRITDDGDVGAQTWGQAFNTGGDTGDLGGAFYAPFAADPRTQPRKLTPDGQDLGPNPDYDPDYKVHAVYLNFGSGVSRAEVLNAARAIVKRNTTGYNFAGTITLKGDPEECWRGQILAGNILSIRHLAGAGASGVSLHIATVSHDDPESDEYPVTLTVDTKYRDAPTLTQLIEDRREARNDPARQLRLQETGKLTQSTRPPFDRDNSAGLIRKHTVQGGYWRVVRFAATTYGEFVELIATTSPETEFTLGLFVKLVSPNFLRDNVGNPLDPSSTRPWDVNRDVLKNAGLVQAWGSGAQPGGYSSSFTGAKTAGDPLSGRIEDDTSTRWASFHPPWLWLAEYAAASTDLTVTFRNAPEQV